MKLIYILQGFPRNRVLSCSYEDGRHRHRLCPCCRYLDVVGGSSIRRRRVRMSSSIGRSEPRRYSVSGCGSNDLFPFKVSGDAWRKMTQIQLRSHCFSPGSTNTVECSATFHFRTHPRYLFQLELHFPDQSLEKRYPIESSRLSSFSSSRYGWISR